MKPGARYISSTYIKIDDESAILTVCLGEQFHCIWECSCGMRGGRSDGATADITTIVCRASYRVHCTSAHLIPRVPNKVNAMAVDKVTVKWIGGIWDGRALDIIYQTAVTMLGNIYQCPSHGAPFVRLEDEGEVPNPMVRYQASDKILTGGILYLWLIPPAPQS